MNYSQSVLSEFERQIAGLLAGAVQRASPPQSVSLGGVSQEAFNNLQSQVAQLIEQNAKLQAQLAEKAAERHELRRRV